MTILGSKICICAPNLIEIGLFWLKYSEKNHFQNGGRSQY